MACRADVDRPAGVDRERDERLRLTVEEVEPLQRGSSFSATLLPPGPSSSSSASAPSHGVATA